MRSQRYAMVVEDGVVKTLNVEDAPGKADVSGADNLLKGALIGLELKAGLLRACGEGPLFLRCARRLLCGAHLGDGVARELVGALVHARGRRGP